jgi:uncharacterized protein (TIGR02118 family)
LTVDGAATAQLGVLPSSRSFFVRVVTFALGCAKGVRVIKIVFCLRRLPTLSPDEFYRYWLESHGPLVRSHAATLGIRRYTQGHAISDPRLDVVGAARGCRIPPYDGVAEVYWDSVQDMIEASTSVQGQEAGRALLEDERRFIDLPNSSLFFVRDHEIVAGLSPSYPQGG